MRETRTLDCVAITRIDGPITRMRVDAYGPGVGLTVITNTRSQAFDIGKRLLDAELYVETKHTKKAATSKVD